MMKRVDGPWAFRVAMLVFVTFGLCPVALGETWWVNNETGRDTFDGL